MTGLDIQWKTFLAQLPVKLNTFANYSVEAVDKVNATQKVAASSTSLVDVVVNVDDVWLRKFHP